MLKISNLTSGYLKKYDVINGISFELDYGNVGVIIGEDIRYENGEVITDFTKRAKTDNSLKGIKSLYKANPEEAQKRADEIIRNTYRTLLTRGMKGCYIYCVDPELEQYLKDRLKTLKVS